MAVGLNRESLIENLEPIAYEAKEDEEQAHLEQMNMAGVILTLAEVNHEREYELCRSAAMHLLGEVNEPEDIVFE